MIKIMTMTATTIMIMMSILITITIAITITSITVTVTIMVMITIMTTTTKKWESEETEQFHFLLTPLTTRSFTIKWKRNKIVGVGSRRGRIHQTQCSFPHFVIGLVLPLLLATSIVSDGVHFISAKYPPAFRVEPPCLGY